MQEIEDNNGGWNPSEIYEINKTEQAEKDLNEYERRGAITNYEVEQNEINAEELEQEREENFKKKNRYSFWLWWLCVIFNFASCKIFK